MKPFVEWLERYNKRGLLGEYGIPDNDERWLKVLDNMLAYLQQHSVPGTYWSAGPRWGDYKLAVQPYDNYTSDRPQMAVLEKYTYLSNVEEPAPGPPANATLINDEASGMSVVDISVIDNHVTLLSAISKNVVVYNFMGSPVSYLSLLPDRPVVIQLPEGLYIVESNKFIIAQ